MAKRNKKRVLRVDVKGEDSQRWAQLREKFLSSVERLLDTVVTSENETVADLGKGLFEAGVSALRARLDREGLQNEEIEAKVLKIYSERERNLAEARKISAEADKITFETNRKRLLTAMRLHKAMLVGEKGDEALLFGARLDAMILALADYEGPGDRLLSSESAS